MFSLRKIDLVLQAVLMIFLLMMWLFESTRIFAMAGHILLGGWQVLSALGNTHAMSQGPFRQRIIIYWVASMLDLIVFAIVPSVWAAAMAVGALIAIYYWIIYRSFIAYLSHRKELSTVIRHT